MRPLLRGATVAALALSVPVVIASAGGSIASGQSPRACEAFDELQDMSRDLGAAAAEDFDAGAYRDLGQAFSKASKNAPKKLKPVLRRIAKVYTSLGDADSLSEVEDRSDELSAKDRKALRRFAAYYAANCSGGAAGAPGSGGGGSLTLGDEVIPFDSARCFLQDQTAAGQEIELTAQAFGTNAAGDAVSIDFTRYAASSDFSGDDISVVVGDPRSDDAASLGASLDIGGVDRAGSTLSASNVALTSSDSAATITASFEINC
jgi:hypothetical protein